MMCVLGGGCEGGWDEQHCKRRKHTMQRAAAFERRLATGRAAWRPPLKAAVLTAYRPHCVFVVSAKVREPAKE